MAIAYAGHKLKGDWTPSAPCVTLTKGVGPDNPRLFEFEFEDELESIRVDNSLPKSVKNISTNQFPMKCIRITNYDIVLSTENIRPTRMTQQEPEKFLCLSFRKLNFRDYKNSRECTAKFIHRVLTGGIKLNGTLYEFCGHSNSQLQSRVCYLRVSYRTPICFGLACGIHKRNTMDNLINKKGNFKKINDVFKRSKRIALLFTSSISNFELNSNDTISINDIKRKEKNFTDGCGFIDSAYAEELVQEMRKDLKWKTNYNVSVFQIRYKGFKGILLSIPTPEMQRLVYQDKSWIARALSWFIKSEPEPTPKVIFRKSMDKFQKSTDKFQKSECCNTLCIVDHSKAFTYGYLNGDLITLLATLGISDSVFQNKLKWYFDLIRDCTTDANAALEMSIFKNRIENAKQLKNVIKGKGNSIPADLLPSLGKLQKDEKDCFYKDGKVKTRILVPKSRLLFGVCDPTNKLKAGECFVKYTDTLIRERDYNHQKVEILLGNIIVSRNPCLHPGDIQHFNAVNRPELDCLNFVDCIVFSVKGDVPAASTMSGGDLDGDKFFVSWDQDLIPRMSYIPEDYSKYTPDPLIKEKIDQNDLINHFSNYNTCLLGRTKTLHVNWVKGTHSRAASPQCIELNGLHSKCVDGGKVVIPKYLESYPHATEQEFILSILEREIKDAFPCTIIPDEDLADLEDWHDIPIPEQIESYSFLTKFFMSLIGSCKGSSLLPL